jgi:hypothetical protein
MFQICQFPKNSNHLWEIQRFFGSVDDFFAALNCAHLLASPCDRVIPRQRWSKTQDVVTVGDRGDQMRQMVLFVCEKATFDRDTLW